MANIKKLLEESMNIVDWRYAGGKGIMMKDNNGNLVVKIENIYSLYLTGNNNFRILINGKVHPLLCGLPNIEAAEVKLTSFDPKGVIINTAGPY